MSDEQKERRAPDYCICHICSARVLRDALVDHTPRHFSDANWPMIVTDPSGAKRPKSHESYDKYTPYGKCLMVMSYLNSDITLIHKASSPADWAAYWRRVNKLTGLRDRCVHALSLSEYTRVEAFLDVLDDGATVMFHSIASNLPHIRNEYDALVVAIRNSVAEDVPS